MHHLGDANQHLEFGPHQGFPFDSFEYLMQQDAPEHFSDFSRNAFSQDNSQQAFFSDPENSLNQNVYIQMPELGALRRSFELGREHVQD